MPQLIPGTGVYNALEQLLAQRNEARLQAQTRQDKLQQQTVENSLRERQQKAAEAQAAIAQQGQRQSQAVGLANMLSPGQTLTPDSINTYQQGGLGALIKPPQQLDGIPQFSGTLDENRTEGVPQTRNVGTFSQQEAQAVQRRLEEQSAATLKASTAQHAATFGQAADRNAEIARHNQASEANARTAANKPPALVAVQTVDDQGRPVTRFVEKSAGQDYQKPLSATSANRADSAEAVTKTGNDIIAQVSDPAYAAKLGPVLGRYNSVREFIGNPPPEYAQLAGEIESYALANMGVHGMRSVVGADEIKKLLDARHTPESLIATVRGLGQFSKHFLETTGRPVPGQAPAAPPSAKRYNPATGKVE